jgi:hypothetical protein
MNHNKSEPKNEFFHLLSSYILFLFLIQVITIGLSLVQVRISPWIARAIMGVSIALALVFFLKNGYLLKSLDFLKRLRRWQIPFLVFLGIVVFTYIFLWAAATIMPDLSYDGNAYHIPAISMWDARGYIYWVNTNYLETLINGYPKGVELVAYVLVKAFNNSIINAVNLIFLPIGVLGISYMARALGTGRLLSLTAGAAFILIPVNINQSITTYVDTAYAACAVGLIAALVHLAKGRGIDWKGIFTFGAAMGLTISTKSTGLALSGICILALAGSWIKDSGFFAPPLEQQTRLTNRGKVAIRYLIILLVIGLVAIAGGGYWYIRNFIFTGSPLYPVGITVLGRTIFPGVPVSEAIAENINILPLLKDMSPVTRVIFDWAQGVKAWPLSIKGYDSRSGGLGFIWLFGCIPAFCISLVSFPKLTQIQQRILLILACVIGLDFLISPLNWWARYTIWIYALGLPCFAFALSKTVFNLNIRPWLKFLTSTWLLFCLGLLLFEAVFCLVDVVALASPGSLRSNLANAFKASTWDWPTSYLFPDMRGTILDEVLTQPGTVVIGPHGNMDFWRYAGLIGELAQPIGNRHLEFISESQAGNGQIGLVDVKYILWDASVTLPASLASLADSVTPAAGFLVLSIP